MQQNRVAIVAAGGLAACLLAGCGPEAGAAGATTPAGTSSTTTTPSPTSNTSGATTSAPTTSTTTPAKTTTTSAALAAALDKLSADSRALKSDAALASVRNTVASGLVAARKGLQAARAAAYPDTTRDCGQVSSSLRASQAGAASAAKGGTALVAAAATRQKQIDSLNGSITLTRKLATGQPAGASPSPADIDAAVKAASAQAAVEATSLRDTRASTADGVAKARENAATAAEIYSKVC